MLFTESQSGLDWKRPLGSSAPTPAQVWSQVHVQVAFEDHQGGRLNNLSVHPVPMLE